MTDKGGQTVAVPYGEVQKAAQMGYGFANQGARWQFNKDSAADPNFKQSFTPAAGDPRGSVDYQQQMEKNLPAPMQAVAGVAKAGAELMPGTSIVRSAIGMTPQQYDQEVTANGPVQKAAKYGTVAASLAPAVVDAAVAAPGVIRSLSPAALKESGAGLLQSVAHDANKVPVQLENAGDAALSLMDWQKKTQLGPTINKFLNRITNPKLGQMTYEEARDFYQLLGKLSVEETNKLAPPVRRDLVQMVVGLKQDIGNAADQVGRAAEYYQGLGDYAKGAKLQGWYDTAKDWGTKTAIGGALGALGMKGVSSLINAYRQ
jgi:hypothetical protein